MELPAQPIRQISPRPFHSHHEPRLRFQACRRLSPLTRDTEIPLLRSASLQTSDGRFQVMVTVVEPQHEMGNTSFKQRSIGRQLQRPFQPALNIAKLGGK